MRDALTNRRRILGVLGLAVLLSLQGLFVSACAPEEATEEVPAEEPADMGEAETPADEAADDAEAPMEEGESIRVMGIWGGSELDSFRAMMDPYETDSGNMVEFTGSRDITADLTIATQGGNPPDVAIPAEIGLFQEYAQEGQLVPLSACEGLAEMVESEYPASFVELGTVDGELYGFFMKADTKATIWYDPQFFGDQYEPLTAESSWGDLIALSDQILADGTPPWSMGMESGGASGWPGSDWIQQILINDAGVETYDGIIAGEVAYDDPAVQTAWERFGEVALTEGYVSQGGAQGILATNFQDATYPPFQEPPEAALTYLGGFAAGFIQDQFPEAEPSTDYDFMHFPGPAVTGGANIVYAFDDSDATCSLLSYLASAEAQRIWVERGGFTSVNQNVSLDAYPNDVARNLAEQLLESETFRFDLDDAIGGAFQQAIFEGVTQYLNNPDSLPDILANIEASREQ